MNKENTVYACNRVFFGNKKDFRLVHATPQMNMCSMPQKSMYCIISFTQQSRVGNAEGHKVHQWFSGTERTGEGAITSNRQPPNKNSSLVHLRSPMRD